MKQNPAVQQPDGNNGTPKSGSRIALLQQQLKTNVEKDESKGSPKSVAPAFDKARRNSTVLARFNPVSNTTKLAANANIHEDAALARSLEDNGGAVSAQLKRLNSQTNLKKLKEQAQADEELARRLQAEENSSQSSSPLAQKADDEAELLRKALEEMGLDAAEMKLNFGQ